MTKNESIDTFNTQIKRVQINVRLYECGHLFFRAGCMISLSVFNMINVLFFFLVSYFFSVRSGYAAPLRAVA